LKHLDLFSGIGGFALAASRVWPDYEILSFCEIDQWAQKALKKNFPGVPINHDIKSINWRNNEAVDILTGGPPCQPFSQAGKQLGRDDDRHLWPEMFRVIKEARPRWVVGENVTGIIDMELEGVCTDLESAGYEVQPIVIPACAVGSPQLRERVWIIANSDGIGLRWHDSIELNRAVEAKSWGKLARICGDVRRGITDCVPRSWFTRAGERIPARVDRIRGSGNAIVPQVAEVIFQGIKQVDFFID
jgi:DNA (cytosine-5)-methyltransferase 1